MADEKDEGKREIPDSLKALLAAVEKVIRSGAASSESRKVLDEASAEVAAMSEMHDGIAIPVAIDRTGLDEKYFPLMDGILIEQSKASLFINQIDKSHGYALLIKRLAQTWSHSAAMGAMKIAELRSNEHQCDDPLCTAREGGVGPSEFNAAWMAIIMSAVLGAVRYGQANPDAFKGLEGVQQGDLDQAVVDLLAYVEAEAAKENNEEE